MCSLLFFLVSGGLQSLATELFESHCQFQDQSVMHPKITALINALEHWLKNNSGCQSKVRQSFPGDHCCIVVIAVAICKHAHVCVRVCACACVCVRMRACARVHS